MPNVTDRKNALDKRMKKGYTDKVPFRVYGGVMVSTGILRYDKRGGLGKPVKSPPLKTNDNRTVAMAA